MNKFIEELLSKKNSMKKLLAIISLIASFQVVAQTFVSGGIYSNTTWTLANSPYIMNGNMVIFPGKTLTIEPGVEIQVVSDSTFFTTNMIYLEVRGTLVANGTANLPIVFKSTTGAATTDWQGINVKSNQGGTFQISNFQLKNSFYGLNTDSNLGNSTFTFNDCIFEKNNIAIQINAQLVYNNCKFMDNVIGQAAQYVSGSLTATNCVFKNNLVGFTTVNGSINVTNCIFENNTNGFIGSSGSLSNCTFIGNDYGIGQGGSVQMNNCSFTQNGVGAQSLSYSSIVNSIFSENDIAIEIGDNCTLTNNDVFDNIVGVTVVANNMQTLSFSENRVCGNSNFNLQNLTDKNFSVDGICFCTSDSTTIETFLFDGYDDITKGLVNFTIYNDSCDVVLSNVVKIDLGNTASLNKNSSAQLLFNVDEQKVSASSISGMIEVAVVDLNGAIVTKFVLTESNPSKVLDISKGVYILRVSNDPSFMPSKILIP